MTCRIAANQTEREGHFAVRHRVFVEEQQLFGQVDRDEHDEHAVHLVAVDDASGEVVGAVRCYCDSGDTWYGGRLAVLPEHRKRAGSIGSALCRLAVSTMEEREVTRFLALIQLQNVRFFERMGWMKQGQPTTHCGQQHQLMRAPLYQTATPRDVHARGREREDGIGIAGYAR